LTVCCAVALASDDVYVASDAAVGYGGGFRRIMVEGKWWKYDDVFVLESGSDFALSRIRSEFESRNDVPTPQLLAECVRKVAIDIANKSEAVDYVGAELLFASPDALAVVGGDGGIIKAEGFACIGHGGPLLTAYLTDKLPAPSRRSYNKVNSIVRDGLAITARLCDSVCDPFYDDTTA
jgi:hypothetical protein